MDRARASVSERAGVTVHSAAEAHRIPTHSCRRPFSFSDELLLPQQRIEQLYVERDDAVHVFV